MIRVAAAILGAGLGFFLAGTLGILLAPAPIHPWAGTLVLGCALLGSQLAGWHRRGHR